MLKTNPIKLFIAMFAWSLYFPSIAIFNIGNNTGIQTSLPLGIAITIILFSYNTTVSRRFLQWYGALLLLIIYQISYFFIYEIHDAIYFKNLTHIMTSFFMILLGYLISSYSLNDFTKYYMIGGVFSSIFGITQYLCWNVLRFDIQLLRGMHNNNSFTNLGSIDNIIEFGRSFGFAPEPSIYALLLIPALLIAFQKRYWIYGAIIMTAMFTCMSLTSILFIPVYIVYSIRGNKLLLSSIIIMSLILSGWYINYVLSSISFDSISGDSDLIFRILDLKNNASFISRSNSILSTSEIIISNPLLGVGYTEWLNNHISNNAIDAIESNTGINSLAMLIATIFGMPFFLLLIAPVIKSFSINNENTAILISLFMIIPSLFVLSYYSFYLPWVGLGICSHLVINSQKR